MKTLTLQMLSIILIASVTSRCGSETANAVGEHSLLCEYVGVSEDFNRCENREVVCYSNNGNGLSCKWKE